MPTIYDIAKHVGVSPSTVSRAFTNPARLNGATKDRILAAAAKLHYQHGPKRRAQSETRPTAAGRNGPISFHFFQDTPEDFLQTNLFYGRVLTGALREAARAGLQVVLSTSARRHASEDGTIAAMIELLGEGLILVGPAEPDLVERLAGASDHCILVDGRDESGRRDCVEADNFNGAFAATSYLIAQGHRRIAFLTQYPASFTFEERCDGYFTAMRRAKLEAFSGSILLDGLSNEAAAKELASQLSADRRPTALVLSTDNDAYIVLEASRKLKWSLPGDLSMIGFDDLPPSARLFPPLTTMRVDAELIGRIAMTRLIESLRGDSTALRDVPGIRITTPVRLIERQSCAPPASE